MSLCDICHRKGACCVDFTLSSLFIATYPTQLHALVRTAEAGLPFLPNGTNEKWGDEKFRGDAWVFVCPLLGLDGRCTEYEHRPFYPCGHYPPGEDCLCALHLDNLEGLS
jgi:Fe-S-cluster containining protein